MKPHVIEYRDQHGKSRTAYIEADSIEDAQTRIQRAAANGEAFELIASIKLPKWAARIMGGSNAES